MTTTGGLALTTTMRVIDRVHGDTSDARALALPAHSAGLAPVDIRLLGIADLADCRAAAKVNIPDFAGRHPKLGVRTILGDQLNRRAGRAGNLRTASRPQLNRVNDATDRDVAQGQVVARLDISRRPRLDRIALLQLVRGEDVALLPVCEVQQSDARCPVGVVLDMRHLRRHAILVSSTKVDEPVGTLVPAALVACRDLAGVVASTLFGQWTNE